MRKSIAAPSASTHAGRGRKGRDAAAKAPVRAGRRLGVSAPAATRHPGDLREDTGALAYARQARPDELRVVTVDGALRGWDDPAVRAWFNAAVGVKLLGFGRRYSSAVLPVDTTDFVATHVLSCLPYEGCLYPVAGYRIIDEPCCTAHCLPYPARTLALSANAPAHVRAVDSFLRTHSATAYLGSWTIHPELGGNAALRAALREHFAVGALLATVERGTTGWLVGATLRFKVDRLLRAVGFRSLRNDDEPLAPLHVAHLNGEGVALMYLDGRDAEPHTRRLRQQAWWSRRLHIGPVRPGAGRS